IYLSITTLTSHTTLLFPYTTLFRSVWISQLGYGDAEIDLLAEAIATILHGCKPYTYVGPGNKTVRRAKVDYEALQRGRAIVRQLTGQPAPQPAGDTVSVHGPEATTFLDAALASNVAALENGASQPSHLLGGGVDAPLTLLRYNAGHYALRFADPETAQAAAEW